jgi:hypothetical protein
MREFNRLVILVFLLTTSCTSPPAQLMTPDAERVLVSRTDPADNFELIGPITAQDGSGCGIYGRRGSYDNAVVALRVKAAQMGTNYVAITTITQPHLASQNCFANAYIISGMAYRKVADAPSPIQIREVGKPSAEADLVEKLRKLDDLHRSGALTDEEFQRVKERLLK